MTAAVAHQAHTVEEQVIDVAAVVAAQGDSVEPGRAAAEAGVDPRGIFQRLADGIRPWSAICWRVTTDTDWAVVINGWSVFVAPSEVLAL